MHDSPDKEIVVCTYPVAYCTVAFHNHGLQVYPMIVIHTAPHMLFHIQYSSRNLAISGFVEGPKRKLTLDWDVRVISDGAEVDLRLRVFR